MAQHEVKFNVPKRPLAYNDSEFEVDQNGSTFGELRVSNGGILWVPRNDQLGFKLTWRKLAELGEERGRKSDVEEIVIGCPMDLLGASSEFNPLPPPLFGTASREADSPVTGAASAATVMAQEDAGAISTPVSREAREALDRLTNQIKELAGGTDAPTFLKRLFCHTLDWKYVHAPIPTSVLPDAARNDISEATIVAQHGDLRLCYLRLAKSELLAMDQRKPLEHLSRALPGVLVAFANFGQSEIDFAYKLQDGRLRRISLDRSLFGADELSQALHAMRAFDLKTEEPTPQLEVAERMERQFTRVQRTLRRHRRLVDDPFFREVGRHGLLVREEELQLRREFVSGSQHSSRDKLILANLRLVVWIAYRFRNRGVAWEDLLQEGVCGLLRAADKYDPERGCRFSTYATWWIRQMIRRSLSDDARLIATPTYCFDEMGVINRFKRRFVQEHARSATDDELMANLNLSPEKFTRVLRSRSAWYGIGPLSVEIRSDDQTPFERCSRSECRRLVRRIIKGKLDARSADILRRRFGIGCKRQTLEEIGQAIKLTRERVRQIEFKAIEILRHPAQARKLEPYARP